MGKLMYCVLSFLLLTILFLTEEVAAQQRQTPKQFQEIENDIESSKTLVDQLARLKALKIEAQEKKNNFQLARALYLEMQIADKLREDSSFLFNSRYIDSTIAVSDGRASLELSMQLIKAKRIQKFLRLRDDVVRKMNIKRNSVIDWHNFPETRLQEELVKVMNRAESLVAEVDEPELEDILWLASDKDAYWYPPNLTAIVYTEGLDLLLNLQRTDSINLESTWIQQFEYPIPNSLFKSGINNNVVQWRKKWERNRNLTDEAKENMNIQLVKNVYNKFFQNSTSEKSYLSFIKKFEKSNFPSIRAFAVFQQFLLYSRQGSMFNNRYEIIKDSSNRYAYTEAVNLYNSNLQLIDSFPLIGKIMKAGLTSRIQLKQLTIYLKNDHLPENLIRFDAYSANIDTLFVQIKKRNVQELLVDNPIKTSSHNDPGKVALDTFIVLPVNNDYNTHHSTFQLPPFEKGTYEAYISNNSIGTKTEIKHTFTFQVTALAVINHGTNYFVLNRKTGFPVPNTRITLHNPRRTAIGKTSKYGRFIDKYESSDTLVAISDQDSLIFKADGYNKYNEDVYDKDEYDNLLDYYESTSICYYFTDRAIYRPGQTVHFKGIILIKDKKTGKPLVANWKNLQFDPLTKMRYKILRKKEKAFLDIRINDPFGRQVDSIKVLPNDFGSFSGTFKIPENSPTGEYDFENETIEQEWKGSSFRVEEYKRPGFEIKIEKPKQLLYLGDTIPVMIQLKSFSGAILNGSTLKIKVSVSDWKRGKELCRIDTITNASGEFLLNIVDHAATELVTTDKKQSTIRYYVEAEAIIGTGEQAEADETLYFYSHPISLTHNIPKQIDLAKETDYRISAYYKEEKISGQMVEVRVSHLKNDMSDTVLVFSKITSTDEIFRLNKDLFSVGTYQVELSTYKDNQLIGYKQTVIDSYNSEKGSFPETTQPFQNAVLKLEKNRFIEWMEGITYDSLFCIFHIRYSTLNREIKDEFRYNKFQKGLQYHNIAIPKDAFGDLIVTRIYIRDGMDNVKTERFFIPSENRNIEIIVEKYRSHLTPGTTESFSVSVQTNSVKEAVEVLTGMYDASLDKLEEHRWNLPNNRIPYVSEHWSAEINANNTRQTTGTVIREVAIAKPFWWTPDSYQYNRTLFLDPDNEPSYLLQGRVAGVSLSTIPGFDEVVVTAYGIRRSLTGSISVVRNTPSIGPEKDILIILDGVIYTGNPAEIEKLGIQHGLILKGVDATNLYGARAANGVLLLSTKGPIQLPKEDEPPVVIRKIFNETAFFLPQLHADKNGLFTFKFTLPQTATEWTWKTLAHTKSARFHYLEKTIYSKLPLMVLPELPRFLYEGDSIQFTVKIANTDSTGKQTAVECIVEDQITGENLTDSFLSANKLSTYTEGKSTQYSVFALRVPQHFIHPIKIITKGQSEGFSDGEEHVLPILSRREFTSTVVPIPDESKGLEMKKPVLPADMIPIGVGISIPQQPQAALLYSLPALANYEFNCAEQTTNKMFAHLVAVSLVKNRIVKPSENIHTQNENLPTELAAVTMPWLQLESRNSQHQTNLAVLLDTLRSKKQAIKYLDELISMQHSNGGLPWFSGQPANFYISAYVLGCFGNMLQADYLNTIAKEKEITGFVVRLASYCDSYSSSFDNSNLKVQYLYSSSALPLTFIKNNETIERQKRYYNELWQHSNSLQLYHQAKLITATLRFFSESDSLHNKALSLLESIHQMAITDPEKRIRWKQVTNNDFLSTSAEELISSLMEAFHTSNRYPNVSSQVAKWLLADRNSHEWTSTKAAAAILQELTKTNSYDSLATTTKEIVYGKKKLSVDNSVTSGRTSAYTAEQGKFFLPASAVSSIGPAAKGNIHYYYFSSSTGKSDDSTIRVVKVIERLNKDANTWIKILDGDSLELGERLRITLQFISTRPLDYLVVNEKHPASLEPIDHLSGSNFADGLSYYKSVRDIGHHFFITQLPTGRSSIQYEMKVTKKGAFNSGMYNVQAMYQPWIKYTGPSYQVIVK